MDKTQKYLESAFKQMLDLQTSADELGAPIIVTDAKIHRRGQVHYVFWPGKKLPSIEPTAYAAVLCIQKAGFLNALISPAAVHAPLLELSIAPARDRKQGS